MECGNYNSLNVRDHAAERRRRREFLATAACTTELELGVMALVPLSLTIWQPSWELETTE